MTIRLASGTEIVLTTEELQELKAILAPSAPIAIPSTPWNVPWNTPWY